MGQVAFGVRCKVHRRKKGLRDYNNENNLDIFSHISHTQHIRQDKTCKAFISIKTW